MGGIVPGCDVLGSAAHSRPRSATPAEYLQHRVGSVLAGLGEYGVFGFLPSLIDAETAGWTMTDSLRKSSVHQSSGDSSLDSQLLSHKTPPKSLCFE